MYVCIGVCVCGCASVDAARLPQTMPVFALAGDGGGAAVCKYFQFLAFFCDSRDSDELLLLFDGYSCCVRFSGSFIL